MKTLNVNSILKSGKLHYKIEKVLGQGSFGITYLASTTIKVEGPLGSIETPIKVAIKEFFMRDINGREEGTVTCSNQNGLYDRYKEKFIKEAQNLSKLKHRHIIKVLEVFEANNTYYYVMEFCEGGSLDDEIAKQGNLTEEETKRYARQIADALSYMHDNKMLHLDLKPGNAMLRGDGDVVLIDFGLSKQYDENGQPESSTTIGGGTPGYAPIEQSNYDGKGFPKTMDIYALGGTMFKMLTGKRPPEASIILNCGFPSEELRQQGVSEQTIGCIERSMSFRVADRPQSIAEFIKILDGKGLRSQSLKDAKSQSADDEETILDVNSDTDNDTDYGKGAPITASAPKTPETPKKKKSKAWIFILLAIILGGAGYLSWRALYISANYISAKYTALMVEGDNFLNTGQYEFARFSYETALKLEEDYAILCDIGILSGESRDKLALIQEKEQEAARLAEAQKEAEAKAKAEAEKKRLEAEKKKKEQEAAAAERKKYNGHKYVDLGLSVKWATCNVGASKPEDYGNYYAWGEVSWKSEYTEDNSITYGKNITDIKGSVLYDAARANWGGTWRLPTKAELEELKNKCTWKWTTQNGVNGYKVTGPNGNSIFLPAAGYREETSLIHDGYRGFYWSSTPYDYYADYAAYYLSFNGGREGVYYDDRDDGLTVRPITE
ncbi:MAG: protein kinase [Bacteroidales bacterium]|nr:protein kinase [Bacteroidales bacterium]